jgi:outer membrane protein OmpA-like peptidoglycan-associated protein
MSLLKISIASLLITVSTLTSSFVGFIRAEDCGKAKQYYSLGTKLSDYRERVAAFEKAVQLCPSYVEAHVNLADAFEHLAVIQSGDAKKNQELFDLAILHYLEAIELNPHFYVAYLGLAEVYAAEGLYQKAKQACEKAMELIPGDEKISGRLTAIKQAIDEEEKEDKTASRDGFRSANQIVHHVKTSSLAEEMSSMGPADFTVVRARLRFPNIIFDGWSAKLNRNESIEQLKEIGKALSSRELDGYTFCVDGHANTVGLEQKEGAYKLMKLSEERAKAVKKYFVREFGISSNRINARGFGCTRLQFPDDTDEHREKNRRVEIVFRRQGKDQGYGR